MSLEALTVVLNHSKSKGAAKIVLMGIANHLGPDADEGAWPAQARLSRYANITERGTQKAIQQLVELGELVVMEHAGKSAGRNKPNRYLITLVCPPTCDGQISHKDILTTRTFEPDDTNLLPTTRTFERHDTNSSSSEPIREPILRTSNNPSQKRLPEDWQPKEVDLQVMSEHFPSIDIKLETHAFRDYWNSVAGAKGKKLDWDATWRNWIRNAHKRSLTKNKSRVEEDRRRQEIEDLLRGEQ